MEKKKFEAPKIEFIPLSMEDIITASSGCDCPMRPGHGWGDENHRHEHWKDAEE